MAINSSNMPIRAVVARRSNQANEVNEDEPLISKEVYHQRYELHLVDLSLSSWTFSHSAGIIQVSYESFEKYHSLITLFLSTSIRMRRYLFVILCIAVALILLLLALFLVLYIVIPVIVRSTIDKAELKFRSVNIEQIQADRFRLVAQLEIAGTGSIPATILSPFVIHVNDVGTVNNSASLSINGDPSIVPIDAPFVVSNLPAFYNFSRSLIFEEKVQWHLKANATIRPLGRWMLSYSGIPFDKQVMLDALYSLPNVSIDSISLDRSDEHHIFADLTIKIINPSVFSIDLGALAFSLQYNNWYIGYVKSVNSNTTLYPGVNTIPLTGELQSMSAESYKALSTVVQNFITNQTSEVEALAGPNATSYPLLAVGMMGLALRTQMPPFREQLIRSLTFESMSLVPSVREKKVVLSASILININSPLGVHSPLAIQSMDMSASLMYKDQPVGMLNVFKSPVRQYNATTYQSAFNNESLVLVDSGLAYENFAQDFIGASRTNPIEFRIVGVASIVGSFALGPLNVNGILVSNTVSLVGLDGLSHVIVNGITIEGEEGAGLRLGIDATIENPGITDVELQNFTFHLVEAINNTHLGEIPIGVLAAQPGKNHVALSGIIAPAHPGDLPMIGRFFSSYLNGQTQPVRLFHDKTTSSNASAMDLTVSGLSIQADLFGIQGRLIHQIDVLNFGIDFDPDQVNRVYVSGEFQVLFQLPTNVNMTFKALTTSIDYKIRLLDGTAVGQMSLADIVVQHNQTTNEILMRFDREELEVTNSTAFSKFAADLVLTKEVAIMIDGCASSVAQVRIGNLTLSDIPLNNTLHLTGYDQFGHGLMNIDEIDIIGTLSEDSLILRVKTELLNPSVVNILNGGRLSLDLCDTVNGTSLGLVNIDPFFLEPEGNKTIVEAEGIFNITHENKIAAQTFISRMVSGIDSQVELRGTLPDNSTGTSIPLLALAIGGLRIQTIVPGLSGDKMLVREIILKRLTPIEIAGIPLGLVRKLSTRIRIKNPFSSTLVIDQMNIRADYSSVVDEDKQVGIVDDSKPIVILPHEELITPYVTVALTAKLPTMISLLGPLLAGDAHLSLSGSIGVTIENEFSLIKLPFTALNVKTDQEAKD